MAKTPGTHPNHPIYIYGKHAVTEALAAAPHAIERVLLAASVDDPHIHSLTLKAHIPTSVLNLNSPPSGIDQEAVHQGVVAVMSLTNLVRTYKEFAKTLMGDSGGVAHAGDKVTAATCIVLLDELQDPQNVGAVIRSAAAFGVAGILIPEHNQAQITGAVIKVSAGMAFRVPLISIGNVNNTIRDLKDLGFWIYGLDGEAKQDINAEKFDVPTVFVLGGEARGIREKTRELCDILINIPTDPKCESLNAAASAAVALYAWSVKHPPTK